MGNPNIPSDPSEKTRWIWNLIKSLINLIVAALAGGAAATFVG